MFEQEITRFLDRHHYDRVVPRAALIDMDGTLFDSMGNHAKAWQRMVSELGIESRPEEFLIWEGRTGASVINELFRRSFGRDATAEEIEKHYHRKTLYFREHPAPEVMPGAPQMLATLVGAGIRCVLVTGSAQNTLISRLDDEFPGVFAPDMRVTALDVVHGKPHPEPFIRGMQKARVKPSEALAIDNAPLGVKSAASSGAFAIGVVTGNIPPSSLAEAGAAVVFNSMVEMAERLPILLLELLTVTRQ